MGSRGLGICLIFLTGLFTVAHSQIEIGGEKNSKKKKTKKEKSKEITAPAKELSSTEVVLSTNWSITNRNLTENEGIFSNPLGERANETRLSTWSFGLGYRNQLNKYFALQAGISYMRNGESYRFEQPDTLYTYNTKYSYIGMPIKGFFTWGDKVKLLAGIGIVPQMFLQYRQDVEWRDSNSTTGTETDKRKNGFSSFVLSGLVNVGVQYKFANRWSVLVMPEYRMQLTDSYTKTDSYDHFGRAFGVNVGLTMRL